MKLEPTFQRLLDRLIGPEMEPHAFAYFENIIIVSKTFEEHLEWLQKVLRKIKEARLEINPDKCEFCCSQVRYLSFLVNESVLQTDPDKIKPILNYLVPRNVKKFRRFLGMALMVSPVYSKLRYCHTSYLPAKEETALNMEGRTATGFRTG